MKHKYKPTRTKQKSVDSFIPPSYSNSINVKPLVVNSESHNNIHYNGNIFQQPEMRFKPRTDFERVFDTVKESPNLNTVDNGILTRHLTKLNLNKKIHSNKNNKYHKDKNDQVDLIYKKSIGNQDANVNNKETNNKTTNKNNELLRKRYDDIQKYLNKNSEAKKILNELHIKTHFKAVTEMSNNRLLTKTKTLPYLHKAHKIFNFQENDTYSPKDDEILFKQNDDYKLNINPFKKKETFDDYNENKKQLLQKLINKPSVDSNSNNDDIYYSSINEISDKYKKEKNNKNLFLYNNNNQIIKVNGVSYNTGTQLNQLAKVILNKCNVIHNKSKHNQTSIQPGNGKLMITNGLTLKQFESKYNF